MDYEKYIEEQQNQGAILANMERSYSALATSHRDLNESHAKIVKREKKRGKLFKRFWKMVKGIFKVRKPNQPIPSPRLASEDEEPAEWSADDDGVGDAESVGDNIS